MAFETILLDKSDHVATITLNRPESLNAVTPQMFAELKQALAEVNDDSDTRVLVLTGAGRAFCASADLQAEGAEVGKRFLPHMPLSDIRRFLHDNPQQVTLGLHRLQKPTIAMVNGLAIGDGLDWALACDMRVGSEKARFMNAYLQMALFPCTGSTWLLPRILPLGKALELLCTGDWLNAEEAYRLGLLNRLVPADELLRETMVLAGKIAKGPPAAIRLLKSQTYKGLESSLEDALQMAADGETMMLATEDHVEAVSAWLQKRQPTYVGR